MTKTIFVTGASGFIAKHIVLQLLEAGYNVRGSVRNQAKADEVRTAIQAHLKDGSNLDTRLTFAELDLTSDAGWTEALAGADALLHTASPFPLAQPKNADDLIRPAVDGTLRALKAAKAAGVSRVVLTSSVAAVYAQKVVPDNAVYAEADWTDPDSPAAYPYIQSKTLAERAAWDYVADNPDIILTTINPSLVLGPALDRHIGSSLKVVQRVLRAKDPAVPAIGLDVVDVRDIARMHVAALSKPDSQGKRVIGSAGFVWFQDIALHVKSICPDRKVVTRLAPNWFLRLFALFDAEARTTVPFLGKRLTTDNSRAREVLGIDFIPTDQAISASVEFLIANDLAD